MRYQLKIWHVLYLTALVAVSVTVSWWLLVIAGVWFGVLLPALELRKREERVSYFGKVLLGIFLLWLLWGLSVPAVQSGHRPSRRTICQHNVRQIMLALTNFQSANAEFPEAAMLGSDGKPMHSWRVQILPYLDESALFKKYDFSKPWDSPENLKLLNQMPEIYACPCNNCPGFTEYKLVVGEGSLFDGGPRTFARIGDGASNTIALVEDAANPVEWTRPSDVTIEEAMAVLKPKDADGLPHYFESFTGKRFFAGSYARFDGSVAYAGVYELEDSELRKHLGIDDGIAEDIFDSDYRLPQKSISNYGPTYALLIFILLMCLPLIWVFHGDADAETRVE